MLAAGAALAALVAAAPAQAQLAALGPPVAVDDDPEAVFPAWFEDANGLRLDLCLDDPRCLAVANDVRPPDGEAFWFEANASVPTGAGNAEIVVATEAAFAADGAGQEMSFNRIRLRIDASSPGTYRVIHPYGVESFQVTAADVGTRAINFTEDVGCIPFPGNSCHDGVAPDADPVSLSGRIGPFLQWDPAVAPAAPAGFIGDALTPHEVVGSVILDEDGQPQNYFRVEGPNIGGPGVDVVETDLFVVQGKVSSGSLLMPRLDPADDSGASAADNVTNVARPAFTGVAGAGELVRIYVDGVLAGEGDAGLDGTYEVRLDDDLADGTHQVTARTVSGLLGSEVESPDSPALAVTVDTTDPNAPALAGTAPASPANDNAPRVVGSAEPGVAIALYATASCSGAAVATGDAAALAAPGIAVAVADDTTATIAAEATDLAGNASPCSDAQVYVEDSTAPAAPEITLAPASPSNDATPSFAFTASDPGAVVECSFATGAAAYAPCASPLDLPAQADGAYTFSVRARDAAGNTAGDSAALRIDTVGPAITIANPPAAQTNENQPAFQLAADEPATIECELTGVQDLGACASGISFGQLPDGDYTFRVRGTDAAGNTGPFADSAFTVDTAAPGVAITDAPAAQTTDTTPGFQFASADAGARYECWLRLASSTTPAYEPCASPLEYGERVLGSWVFTVRAVDAAGNTSAAGRSFEIVSVPPPSDAPAVVAPEATVRATGALAASGNLPVTIRWSAQDADGIRSYQLQQRSGTGAFVNVPLANVRATSVVRTLAAGRDYQFRVRATDNGGRVSDWVAGEAVRMAHAQETSAAIGYASAWTRLRVAGSFGGSVRHASNAGARATYAFTGRTIAWVSTRAKNRGKAEVWIDGALAGVVDLYAATMQTRRVVFAATLDQAGAHTIQIRVLGQHRAGATGNRVDVDAFTYLSR